MIKQPNLLSTNSDYEHGDTVFNLNTQSHQPSLLLLLGNQMRKELSIEEKFGHKSLFFALPVFKFPGNANIGLENFKGPSQFYTILHQQVSISKPIKVLPIFIQKS